jgi:hypothetical protein
MLLGIVYDGDEIVQIEHTMWICSIYSIISSDAHKFCPCYSCYGRTSDLICIYCIEFLRLLKKKKKPRFCIYTSLLQIIWLGPRRILPKLFPTMFLIKFIMQEDNLFLFLEFELFILTPFKSENVSFIPQLTNNLFYVGQFVEYNCLDVSSLFGWVVRNLDTNRVIMKGIKLEDCFIWFYMQHPQKQFI